MGSQNLVFLLLFVLLLPNTIAQAPSSPSLRPDEACKGVFLNYSITEWEKTFPHLWPDDPAGQPYKFKAVAIVLNTDDVPLKGWNLKLKYLNGTVIVSATSAAITDGSDFPYIVNGSTGVSFSGQPNTDLKTAIETAGDISQIHAKIEILGTQFGVSPPARRLPSDMLLDMPEFSCSELETTTSETITAKSMYMYTCCTRNPDSNETSPLSTKFLSRKTGDLTISYDVIQSYPSSYLALVKINNSNPLGRLDNWRLTWKWKRDEFIYRTWGALTNLTDFTDCIHGPQGKYYKDLDFHKVQNCQRKPIILDLPPSVANDTKLGRIPFCCRNGTILPTTIDPSKSISAFQLQVYKMPPDLNRTTLYPPENWAITGSNGALNPTYTCGRPIRVKPTVFPHPGGLPTSSLAIASWQVVCNITRPRNAKPRCCVSFSGFYNDSVVPCKTCACGCKADVDRTCSSTSPAMLLPPEALLVPFANRTKKALAWAAIKHYNVPNPLPCGDNCGVSINWHVVTDYTGGWTARITLFNWGEVDIPNWFAAIVMDKAYDGYEKMYSFNGTAVGNDTIFMRGLPGLNYLIGLNTKVNPMDPGKLQSVISFTKKQTPGIDVVGGGGFPSEVIFNGERCSLPTILPTSEGFRTATPAGRGRLPSFVLLVAIAASLVVIL